MALRVCSSVLAVLCACGPVSADDIGTESTGEPVTTGESPVPTTSSEDSPTGAAPTSEPPADTSDTGDAPPSAPDGDGDGVPDDIDVCPSIFDNGLGDADRDGIGNLCDLCPEGPGNYNVRADDAQAPFYMRVRRIPHQADFDRDGIGDVCDNCIVVPNCGDFGVGEGLTPAQIGDDIPSDHLHGCQTDKDGAPYLGDACRDPDTKEVVQLPGAAGPVGFLDADDFDQDGLANVDDRCPRIRGDGTACASDAECGGRECTAGRCNHADSDDDGVGDLCDTCPFHPNPKQILDGGEQEDDADVDFIGVACEVGDLCALTLEARPIGFNTLSANGECCVVLFDADAAPLDPGRVTGEGDACTVVDPAVPLRVDCPADQEKIGCRRLPADVVARPGVVTLPPGCAAAGQALTIGSPGIETHDDLYRFACRMPARDRDFDGFGDNCDFCPDAFDPDNSEAFCTGDYDPATVKTTCP